MCFILRCSLVQVPIQVWVGLHVLYGGFAPQVFWARYLIMFPWLFAISWLSFALLERPALTARKYCPCTK